MRVAVVYQGKYPLVELSAGVRRVRDIANAIARTGCKTTFICPRHFGDIESDVPGDAFKTVHLGPVRPSPSMASRVAFWNSVRRYICEKQPSFTLFYNTTIDSLLAMGRLPSVGFELCDLHSLGGQRFHRRLICRVAEYYLPRISTLNITISSGIKSHLVRCAPAVPVAVVPCLVDLCDFRIQAEVGKFREKHGIPADRPIITFSGSWYRQKGLATLVQSFAAVLASVSPRPLLVVAGRSISPEDEDNPAELARALRVDGDVLMTGSLATAQLTELLADSDIVVSASIRDKFSELSFPTKLAEFAAMGKAIVTTSVGDMPRYFQDGRNALLCEPSDVPSMTNAIIRLAESPELRRTLGSCARETALACFSLEAAGKTLVDAISGRKSGVG